MIAGILPNKFGTIGGLLNLPQTEQRERPHPMCPEHHRIERAEMSCDVGRLYRLPRIAGLALHECKRVMSEGIVGTETNGLIEVADGAVMRVREPLRSTHRAMCRRIAGIRHEGLAGSLEGQSDLALGF